MIRIVGIAGSLRRDSFNRALLRAAASHAPDGVTVQPAEISRIPLYDGDVEKRSVPDAVKALKDEVSGADALLLVSPEYNHGIPGVMKNVIDWMSRPPADIKTVFRARPVAVMGATPGPGGTRLAQAAWLPTLRALGTRPWFGGQLYVPKAGEAFDEHGNLVDEQVQDRLRRFLQGFADFVNETRNG